MKAFGRTWCKCGHTERWHKDGPCNYWATRIEGSTISDVVPEVCQEACQKFRPQSNELHVVPRADLIEHDTANDCLCGPRHEPVERDDGSLGWVVVHNSLDGREADEGMQG